METKIGQISELSIILENKDSLNRNLIRLFSRFGMGRLLNQLSFKKTQGVSAGDLVLLLCLFRVNGQSVFQWYRNSFYHLFESGKNCFYRFLSRPDIDWRSLLYKVSLSFKRQIQRDKEFSKVASKAPCCFIIDDTFLEKTGCCIEHVSRVFDHVSGSCKLGFKLLLLAFFDGTSTIGCDFTLHREKGKKGDFGLSKEIRKKHYRKHTPQASAGHIRRKESDRSKIQMALSMLRRAWKHGLHASYVLMDSWFTSSEIIREIRKTGKGAMHVIGLVKVSNQKYAVKGRMLHTRQIILVKERKESHYCRKYNSRYIKVKTFVDAHPVVLFFIRYGQQSRWHLLLSSDTSLNFVQVFELYQIRWNIEVLFKEAKQYLGLGNCQSRDFDAQIADCTLTFITHTILTLHKRFSNYETLGELFRQVQKDTLALTLWERMLPLIAKIIEVLSEIIERTPEELIEQLLTNKGFARKFEYMFACIEQYCPYHEQTA
ncbi:MAG: transposase [Tannerellaceae bacterium]|jgi:hypothetical protein|nr:transposase [Tannerellaceae bacterium]